MENVTGAEVTGAELVVGQCYMYKGKNMGKFIRHKLTGSTHDPNEEYTFKNGLVDDGKFHQREKDFTPVQCTCNPRDSSCSISGGRKRTRKIRRKRNRSSRRYKKHKR